ncbi:MAG TPA: hypothetical protein VHI52_11910, partial [Verrucomicrobiae bacterium]|nr:hypothetical protein [Verrucomicrobiae bacterium]
MREGTKFLLGTSAVVMFAMPGAAQNLPTPAATTPLAKVEVDILYDSNVAGSSAQLAAQRGIERADITFTPRLDVNYFKQLGADSAFLAASAGYDFYQHNTLLNRERLDGVGGLNVRLADCDGTV